MAPAKDFLTISELTNLLNLTLEDYIGEIGFAGEIAEVTRASSGHCYLCLKDELSQINAVVWASKAKTLPFKLEQGLKVRCKGKPNVYPRSGRLQVVLSSIEPAGEGDLQKKFEALKKKLEAEGLFSPARKRPLPLFPAALGVVTSAQGAVIHDILVRIQERMPQLKVYLVDVRVQGPGAAEEIAAGIKYLESLNLIDVMIVGRGGGSLEDLWPFNEEIVCRAIFSCSVPVVSAVGHEVDFTLSDFVADKRAPTPTAAAEMVVPRRSDLLEQIIQFERRLKDSDRWFRAKQQDFDVLTEKLYKAVSKAVDYKQQLLERAALHLARFEPASLLTLLYNKLQLSQNKLLYAVSAGMHRRASTLDILRSRLLGLRLAENVQTLGLLCDRLEQRLAAHVSHDTQARRNMIRSLELRLASLNPESILNRGFALVYKDKALVKSVSEVAHADIVTLQLSDGSVSSTITKLPTAGKI